MREIILKPKFLDERITIELVLPLIHKELFEKNRVHIDDKLLFWEHHFPAFEKGYPNGCKKTGTIRYKKDHIRLPFGVKLPVYETKEFNAGLPPRGIVTLEYVVACQLNEITEDEWLHDGFISQENLFEGMKIYYPEIIPESLVSQYKFKNYDPKPSRKELKRLLNIIR